MSQPTALPSSRRDAGDVPAAARSASPDEGEATVFISYSRRDMTFLDRLDADLQARGVKTLVDRAAIEVGEPWRKRLEDLIARAETIVFVLSPDSINSKVCGEEVEFGRRLGKRFIPVVARRVDNPSVPEALSELNYVFLDDEETYAANVDRLVRAIRTDLAWMRAHADLGRTADEWSRAGRPRGLLLGGTRLKAAEHWISHRPAAAPLPTDDTRDLITASHRAARQRRQVLVGALVTGLVVALGLAGLAYLQRQEAVAQRVVAEHQSALALERQREAQQQREVANQESKNAATQRDRAESNMEAARGAVDSLIFDISRGLAQVPGLRAQSVGRILGTVDKTVTDLLRRAPGDPRLETSRATMLYESGNVFAVSGDQTKALAAMENSLEARRRLLAAAPAAANAKQRAEVADSLEGLGHIRNRQYDRVAARAAFDEALTIRRALVAEDPADGARRDALTGSLDAIAALSPLATARPLYEESYAIRRALAAEAPDNLDHQTNITVSLDRLAGVKRAQGDHAGALALYEQWLDIATRAAAREPENTGLDRNVATALDRIAHHHLAQGDRAKALETFQRSIVIVRRIALADPTTTDNQRNVVVTLHAMADLYSLEGRADDALALYVDALNIGRRIAIIDPTNLQYQRDSSILLDRVADVNLARGELKTALQANEEALATRRRLDQADPGAIRRKDIAYTLERIAQVKGRLSDLVGMRLALEECLALRRGLLAEQPDDPESLRDVWVSLSNLGDRLLAANDREGDRKLYDEGLEIAQRFAALQPDSALYQSDLATALSEAASLRVDRAQARRLLEDARRIVAELEAEKALPPGRENLAGLIRRQLAKLGAR